MEFLSCFICGVRIGKGNFPSLNNHDRMDKLISVSQTVDHSSTIISDILSRILNETVMREETICKICFNLINTIDYHLKEAQEKTDEITNKFLDKAKDPMSYSPQPIVSADKEVIELSNHNQNKHNKENIRNVRPAKKMHFGSKKTALYSCHDTDATLTEDEMSVNMINKNKAKLLSHVLNPNKKSRKVDFKDSDDDDDDESLKKIRSKRPKKLKGQKSKKSSKKVQKFLASTSTSEDEEKSIENKETHTVDELTTVNMEELTDLFSKPKVYFAKKSSVREIKEEGCHSVDLPVSNIPDKPLTLTCDICFKNFKRGTNLQLHKEKVHNLHDPPTLSNVPESHKCCICPREFTNAKSLESHEQEHLNDKDKEVPEKKSGVKSVKTNSTESKISCNICNQVFKRMFNLRTHINRVHEKVKPFVCKICEKTFATNSDLKQHCVVHGQGKPFTCETCGREFSNRDSIILHRKQHNNQRTHFCLVCNKGFYKASCLNRHFRSHTGERPFKCKKCQKTFSQSCSLKNHATKCNESPTRD